MGDSLHIPLARITLDVTDLFLGSTDLKASLEKTLPGLKGVDFSIKLDGPLLSPDQELSLNPMLIQILEADGMPCNPTSYTHLSQTCQPVFCRFKMLRDPYTHEAVTNKGHGGKVPFQSRHLVLPGLMDEDRIRDDLLHKRFVVEVEVFSGRYLFKRVSNGWVRFMIVNIDCQVT
jgi:hypothetical protein